MLGLASTETDSRVGWGVDAALLHEPMTHAHSRSHPGLSYLQPSMLYALGWVCLALRGTGDPVRLPSPP